MLYKDNLTGTRSADNNHPQQDAAGMIGEERRKEEKRVRQGRIGHRPMWILFLSIVLRAFHQIGAAVFLASYLIEAIPGPPRAYVMIAAGSGICLLLAEWMRHREIHRELSGLSTLVKLLLLGLAYHGLFPQTPTILAAFILASLASHAPKQYRHRLLF